MNIFVLSRSPKLAARYHCDKHVIKMILESVQMLSTTHALLSKSHPYKVTHANHPCTIWVRQSQANYDWLRELTFWLEDERQFRYNGRPTHKSIKVLERMRPLRKLPDIGLTPFAQCMPEDLVSNNAVRSYRDYYHLKTFAAWTKRKVPYWFNN